MFKYVLVAAALAVASATTVQAQQVAAGSAIPWPATLKHAGAGKVPPYCAAFVRPNGWMGSWKYGNIAVGLFVERVVANGDGTCQAIVGYGWGPWRGGGPGYTPGITATIAKDGTMTVPLAAISATATFAVTGGTIEASWVRGNTRNHGTLTPR